MVRIVVILILMMMSAANYAAEGGLSNYIPAFYGDLALAVEPPDGFSYRNDVYYFSGDIGESVRSGLIRGEVDVTLVYNFFSFLYKPQFKIFNAPVAFAVTPSIGYVDVDASFQLGAQSASTDDDKTSIGDTTLSAFMYWNFDKYHFSWNNFIVTPTGDYDVDELANTGLNYWTLETDFAATYFNEDTGQDYSIVAGYGYNTKNADTDYQSGDEIHVDFVLNQFFTESFAIGVIGYFYKQVGSDSGDGAILGGFKGEGAGIGPSIYYGKKIKDNEVYFIAKWMHDYHAENRIKGDSVFASFAVSF